MSNLSLTASHLKIERVQPGRWLVVTEEGSRLGEVFGGKGYFQAQTMRGVFVGEGKSRIQAAQLLMHDIRAS